MTAQEINEQLHRPIWSGFGYDRYFPESACQITNLATGNTAVAIKEMAKWAKKYAHHCKDIAPILYGDDLEDTVNSIQDFLYNHIQYSIDGENQNLKSPACAWATRVEGTDCKSYSIFASAILLNLDIKHYLRRIKQASVPDAYTHVYVVVPIDQKTGKLNNGYFIIDGTIQLNNELAFTAKDDIFMEPNLTINGLAGALGCADNPNYGCNSTAHNQRPYDLMYNNYPGDFALAGPDLEQQSLDQGIAKFNELLDYLEANGIPAEYTDIVIQNMQIYLDLGIEPTLGQLLGLDNPVGLGFSEQEGSALVTAGANAIFPGAGTIISALIPKDFLDKTFGAIFANGFDLSCWGSTYTPSKVGAEVQTIHVPYFTNLLQLASNSKSTLEVETNFNRLLKAVDISYDMYGTKLKNGANWRGCSQKAIAIYIDVVNGAKAQADILLKNLQSKYNISVTTASVPSEFTYTQDLTGQPDLTRSEKQHGKSTYRIIKFNERIEDSLPVAQTAQGDNPKQAGGNIGMILIAAAAVGGLVYTQTKKPKTK